MKKEASHPTEWTLKGCDDSESISRRFSLLTAMFETARSKGADIAQLRQTNLNYAILIFAALFTFSLQLAKGWYSVAVSAGLCFTMSVFSGLDRRFHKFIHGWRATEKHFVEHMVEFLNAPDNDLTFRRYISEAEKTAEFLGLQPVITYSLVAVSTLHFAYCLWLAI